MFNLVTKIKFQGWFFIYCKGCRHRLGSFFLIKPEKGSKQCLFKIADVINQTIINSIIKYSLQDTKQIVNKPQYMVKDYYLKCILLLLHVT